jgi:uncharacterized protein with von Willebrand factor type A (vWA) domain
VLTLTARDSRLRTHNSPMALHHFRYSQWDGSQDVPDFDSDEILESMSDDLLRGGDPQQALRNLLRRGFRLPDGRRFDGMQRLLQRMQEYRHKATSRYDPNGMVDSIREELEKILQTEREEIASRRDAASPTPASDAGEENAGDHPTSDRHSQPQAANHPESETPRESDDEDSSDQPSGSQRSQPPAPDEKRTTNNEQRTTNNEFSQMLERMLERKEQFLDELPTNNAGRIHGLREYDFLSAEAREAFEKLVGSMQRELLEHHFQGLKQGIGNVTPDQMNAIRQMVRDLNEMLEATQAGDREAFDRFMEQYRDFFPEGIESLEDLLEHMQRQMAAMEALLESLDPEQRAELEAMMQELLQDDRLRMDLARLGANLTHMGYMPRGGQFPFRGQEVPGFGQSLDMMRRLQAMQDLQDAMGAGDPFDAMAGAGGHDPQDLFGPKIGRQIEAVRDMAQALLETGYLKREGDRLTLTSRAVRKIGDASLREIFRRLKDDRSGGHTTARKGHGGDILQESRPYSFGDPFHVDIKSTVMNGVLREGEGVPVKLGADDFAVFDTERAVQHATVLAIDMSRSMYYSGLFLDAKKTALALDSLIRGQFPRDALYLVGFASTAVELTTDELPRLVENDYVSGTNYEMAFALARRLLARHRGGNRQILFVTDGEPTAFMLNGRVCFDYPMTVRPAMAAAMLEATRCGREGITINTFVLDPTPHLVRFVEQMSTVNHGRMILTGPYHVGDQVLLDYMQGRTIRRLH